MTKEKSGFLTRGFLISIALQLLGHISQSLVLPVLPFYILELGGSLAATGMVIGMFPLIAMAIRPFSGYITDRFDQKALLAGSFTFSFLGFLGYCLSPNLPVFILSRVIHAIGFSFQSTVTIAIAFSFIPEGRTGEGIGYFSLMQVVSVSIGPLLGTFLMGSLGYRLSFVLPTVLLFLAVLGSLSLPLQRRERGEAAEVPLREGLTLDAFISRKSLPLTFVILVFSVGSALTASFIMLVGEERGIVGTALFFTVSAIGMFLARLFTGKVIDRHGSQYVILPGFLFEASCLLAVAFTHSLAWIVLAAVFRALGHGIAQPALQTQMLLDDPDHSGVVTSTFMLGQDIGQALGPFIGGFVADSFGYTTLFAGCPTLLLAALGIYIWWLVATRSKAGNGS